MLKKADMRKGAPPEPPLAACPHFLLCQAPWKSKEPFSSGQKSSFSSDR